MCGLHRPLQSDALTVAACCSDGRGATMLGCLRYLAVYSLGVCVCACVCVERGGGVWECVYTHIQTHPHPHPHIQEVMDIETRALPIWGGFD